MVETFAYCLGIVAPYYNLALVVAAVLLFIHLFRTPYKKTFIKPWKLVFAALLVFVVEEIVTVLTMANVIPRYNLLFPLLEMIIITLFIYALLLQKESLK
jgi:hypothetical protein